MLYAQFISYTKISKGIRHFQHFTIPWLLYFENMVSRDNNCSTYCQMIEIIKY